MIWREAPRAALIEIRVLAGVVRRSDDMQSGRRFGAMGAGWLAMLLVGSGVAWGKTAMPVVYFGSGDFWKGHDIALVVVESVEDPDQFGSSVVVRTEKQLAGKNGPETQRLLRTTLSVIEEKAVGANGQDAPPQEWDGPRPKVEVGKGDELLLCAMHDNDYVVVVKLAGPAEKSALAQTVGRLAVVNAAGTEAGLKEGTRSTDSLVVSYSIRCLLAAKAGGADADFVAWLKKLRDTATLPMEDRLASNRLWPRYAEKPEEASKEAGDWFRGKLEATKEPNADYAMRLERDVMDSFDTREERVEYLVGLVRDVKRTAAVRQVAARALTDHACFDFEAPASAVSSKAFLAILALLRADESELRKTGASMAYQICCRLPASTVRTLRVKEALGAVDAAIASEKDEYVKAYQKFLNELLTKEERATELPM